MRTRRGRPAIAHGLDHTGLRNRSDGPSLRGPVRRRILWRRIHAGRLHPGAARSPGGKPIICLASTTDDGASRIKPFLETGDGVGIARSDVHYVVTEYG